MLCILTKRETTSDSDLTLTLNPRDCIFFSTLCQCSQLSNYVSRGPVCLSLCHLYPLRLYSIACLHSKTQEACCVRLTSDILIRVPSRGMPQRRTWERILRSMEFGKFQPDGPTPGRLGLQPQLRIHSPGAKKTEA